MKKTILMSAMFALVITSFSSCKKDWSCSCTDQNGNSVSTPINNETLLNARAKCKNMDYNVGGASETCALQ
jgi:hypothetical protein